MDFEWDAAKSERNLIDRGLAFELAESLFERRVIEQRDDRRDYSEVRIQAIGRVGGRILRASIPTVAGCDESSAYAMRT
jgi:uncharacterized DUF497 family protein